MKFKLDIVITLYLAEKLQPDIVCLLNYLKVNKMYMYLTTNSKTDTSSIAKCTNIGLKLTARSVEIIGKVQMRIKADKQQPKHCANKLAKDLRTRHKCTKPVRHKLFFVQAFHGLYIRIRSTSPCGAL